MVRLSLEDGLIHYVSIGSLIGKECFERLDCYEFGMAVFCTGMKTPRLFHGDLPITANIIATIKTIRKTIRGIRFSERGENRTVLQSSSNFSIQEKSDPDLR
jgi:radical SAM superfamily enzyme with C-terminal helix-hairpin-helix motif